MCLCALCCVLQEGVVIGPGTAIQSMFDPRADHSEGVCCLFVHSQGAGRRGGGKVGER